MLTQCVAESDLVFESSAEDIKVKTNIAKQVSAALKPTAVSCTGTSGLSITEIASCYPEELADTSSAFICSIRLTACPCAN